MGLLSRQGVLREEPLHLAQLVEYLVGVAVRLGVAAQTLVMDEPVPGVFDDVEHDVRQAPLKGGTSDARAEVFDDGVAIALV